MANAVVLKTKCPYCGEEIEVFNEPDMYEWDGECGEHRYSCESCQSVVSVEVEAKLKIVNVEPYAESEFIAKERYIQHCDDLVDLHRDREMGCL